MEWILVLITLQSANPVATPGGVYATMAECFEVREYVMDNEQGARPAQAVCIHTENGVPIQLAKRWD